MAEIVNLRLARKRARRQAEEDRAGARRLAHGIRKSERELIKARSDKAARDIDGHKLREGEPE
jgi:hypothetical protein